MNELSDAHHGKSTSNHARGFAVDANVRSAAAIRDLRVVAFLEGVSYLALLGVAMPLKYFAGMPAAVRVTGTIHGVLFLLYVAAVVRAGVRRRWPILRWAENLTASLLPFGPFLIEPRLRREQRQLRASNR